jgi:hypothetical protein
LRFDGCLSNISTDTHNDIKRGDHLLEHAEEGEPLQLGHGVAERRDDVVARAEAAELVVEARKADHVKRRVDEVLVHVDLAGAGHDVLGARGGGLGIVVLGVAARLHELVAQLVRLGEHVRHHVADGVGVERRIQDAALAPVRVKVDVEESVPEEAGDHARLRGRLDEVVGVLHDERHGRRVAGNNQVVAEEQLGAHGRAVLVEPGLDDAPGRVALDLGEVAEEEVRGRRAGEVAVVQHALAVGVAVEEEEREEERRDARVQGPAGQGGQRGEDGRVAHRQGGGPERGGVRVGHVERWADGGDEARGQAFMERASASQR